MLISKKSELIKYDFDMCVYHLMSEDGKVFYIGSTKSFDIRMSTHLQTYGALNVEVYPVENESELLNEEALHIAKHQPIKNRNLPGNKYFISEHGLRRAIGKANFDYDSADVVLCNSGRRYYKLERVDVKSAIAKGATGERGAKNTSAILSMIDELGGNRAEIAKAAGISIYQLNNAVSKGVQVEKLADGRYVTVRKDATYFGESE